MTLHSQRKPDGEPADHVDNGDLGKSSLPGLPPGEPFSFFEADPYLGICGSPEEGRALLERRIDGATMFFRTLEDIWALEDLLSELRVEIARHRLRTPRGHREIWSVSISPGAPSSMDERSDPPRIDPEEVFEQLIEGAELSGRLEDNGIGSYEYWGSRGSHRDMQFELNEQYGEATIDFLSECFPFLDDPVSTIHRDFVITSSVYSGRHDECFDDGVEVEVEIRGSLERVTIQPFERAGEKLWRVSAHYSWEAV